MGHNRKTAAVARQLGKPYWRLWYLISSGKIPAPARDDSGDYIWSAQDIERARQALAKMSKLEPISA
jgi:hypothetical protein